MIWLAKNNNYHEIILEIASWHIAYFFLLSDEVGIVFIFIMLWCEITVKKHAEEGPWNSPAIAGDQINHNYIHNNKFDTIVDKFCRRSVWTVNNYGLQQSVHE